MEATSSGQYTDFLMSGGIFATHGDGSAFLIELHSNSADS